ncbi:MAG: hypothetical protein NZ870_04985, partial [bacterium]|nr:hypothetical protein [bacterium]
MRFLKGVGEKREKLLKKLGVENVFQLLNHFPIRYENRYLQYETADKINVKGIITKLIIQKTHRLHILELYIDSSNRLFRIFRKTQTEDVFKPLLKAKEQKLEVFLTGKKNLDGSVDVEEYVINDEKNIHHNRLVPI